MLIRFKKLADNEMKGDADKSDIFQHNENKTHANAAHIKRSSTENCDQRLLIISEALGNVKIICAHRS